MKPEPMKKTVEVNKRSLRLALEESLRPMQSFFDPTHGGLPFFGNVMVGEPWGNTHHASFSMAHVPGRWLNALLNAQDVLGLAVDEAAIINLAHWALHSLTATQMGFPACMDVETSECLNQTDLHNLREVMHALTALVRYRGDERAYELAVKLIEQVDRYFDDEKGCLREAEWARDTGGRLLKWSGTRTNASLFPITFGRYIGPLVKFYQATGEVKALRQAMRLKDACFRHVINAHGDYQAEVFGGHTHSTTSTLSSLALLGDAVGDIAILRRVKRFLENGMRQIALDFGWCIENHDRRDDVGEINNTADMLETCLILGKWGFPGYYARAERILRAHLLPAQLLDTSFIPESDDASHPEAYRLASRGKGAFGFPCPYGHEDHAGAPLSFNWDIVGGGAEGLCEAIRAQWSANGNLFSINLLFDIETDAFSFRSPYGHGDMAELIVRRPGTAFRVRIPGNCESVEVKNAESFTGGEWLYLSGIAPGTGASIRFRFSTEVARYQFRDKTYSLRWRGEEITGADSAGKRLCFFPVIE